MNDFDLEENRASIARGYATSPVPGFTFTVIAPSACKEPIAQNRERRWYQTFEKALESIMELHHKMRTSDPNRPVPQLCVVNWIVTAG